MSHLSDLRATSQGTPDWALNEKACEAKCGKKCSHHPKEKKTKEPKESKKTSRTKKAKKK